MDAQIDNFANTRQGIIASIGAPATLSLLKMSLFAVVIGSNDFINNYLTPVVSAVEQKVVAPDVFVDTMVARFRLQLTVKKVPCNYICLIRPLIFVVLDQFWNPINS